MLLPRFKIIAILRLASFVNKTSSNKSEFSAFFETVFSEKNAMPRSPVRRVLSFLLAFFALLSMVFASGCTAYNRNSEGLRLYNQARYNEALNAFQSALQNEPGNQDTLYNLAATYHQVGRATQSSNPAYAQQQWDLAEQHYKQCLTQDPNHTAAYRGLAVLFMERQQPDPAFRLLFAWADYNRTSPEPRIELARLYQEFAQFYIFQRRFDDAQVCQNHAVERLQEALTCEPDNFRALRALGFIFEQSGDIQSALAYYRRSLESNRSQRDLADRVDVLSRGGVPPVTSFPGAAAGTGSYPVFSLDQATHSSSGGAAVYPSTVPPSSLEGGSVTRMGSTFSPSVF